MQNAGTSMYLVLSIHTFLLLLTVSAFPSLAGVVIGRRVSEGKKLQQTFKFFWKQLSTVSSFLAIALLCISIPFHFLHFLLFHYPPNYLLYPIHVRVQHYYYKYMTR